ncbi:hypothetical protein OGY72_07595 [Citrobacter sp. Cpo221]|uniref:hypothetical protein n=1 Tax=Citrobacter sp. Cpo221 TaxID=2985155 RepID=UPI002576A644|nr:hypothetical protein [Citrobacter sp. Cpo221]MDM2753721.1 hypothetical protein [Citrobacter sp. Cpo221]
MLDREVDIHLKQIREQMKGQQAIVQLLIHQILKNLETKPGCENFTNEVVESLEALKSQVWLGKEGIDAAIALTRSPIK